MSLTPITQQISNANSVGSACISASQLLQTVNTLLAQLTAQSATATWVNWGTCVKNADGSLSATPDGSPIQTNPFNVNLPQLAGLNRAATYGQMTSAITFLTALQTFLNLTASQQSMAVFVGG